MKYTIGEVIEVVLEKVDSTRGFIDFVLADQVSQPKKKDRKSRLQPDLKTGKPRSRGKSRRRR